MTRTPRRRNFRDAKRVSPENAPEIPEAVYEGIEACRQSGECNMFEFSRVLNWCNDNEFYATVGWMDENPSQYATGVLSGAWCIIEQTGKESVEYGEKDMFVGLPDEVLDTMNTNLNEQRQITRTIVGCNKEEL